MSITDPEALRRFAADQMDRYKAHIQLVDMEVGGAMRRA